MIPPVLHRILHEKYVQAKFSTLSDKEDDQYKGWQPSPYATYVYPGQLTRGGDFGQQPPQSGFPPTEPPQTPPDSGSGGPRGGSPNKPSGDRPPSRAADMGRRIRGGPDLPSYGGVPSREGIRLSPYFFDDLGGENRNYFKDLVNKYNPPPNEIPPPKSKFSVSPELMGLGKFGTSMAAGTLGGYYPGKITQELTQPYLGDVGSYYAGAAAATAAGIPTAEIAVTGIPALFAGEGIGTAAAMTGTATMSQLANPYTWLAAAGIATILPAEMIKAEQRAKTLAAIEKEDRLRKNKRKTNEILGIESDEDGWWEQLKRAFEKTAALDNIRGNM